MMWWGAGDSSTSMGRSLIPDIGSGGAGDEETEKWEMMEFASFQYSNLLLLIVIALFQRQEEPLVTLILLDLHGRVLDDRRI